MKIEELSVGDWVFHLAERQAGRILHIHRIGEIYSIGLDCADCVVVGGINDIAPIVITPVILEKNGICLLETFEDGEIMYACPSFSVLQRRNFKHWKICTPSMWVHICYIHQLQHTLRLAGIEKEIEL